VPIPALLPKTGDVRAAKHRVTPGSLEPLDISAQWQQPSQSVTSREPDSSRMAGELPEDLARVWGYVTQQVELETTTPDKLLVTTSTFVTDSEKPTVEIGLIWDYVTKGVNSITQTMETTTTAVVDIETVSLGNEGGSSFQDKITHLEEEFEHLDMRAMLWWHYLLLVFACLALLVCLAQACTCLIISTRRNHAQQRDPKRRGGAIV